MATITVREKGKKIEDSGGIVMTVDTWLSKSARSLKEIADFERRYCEKLAGPISASTRSRWRPRWRCILASRMRSRALSREDLGGTPFSR